jgi:cell surface protein SprA
VQDELEKKKAKEEKKKKKAAKKAARKARKARPLALSPVEHVLGHIITIVNRVTLNATETQGTVLPGYMDSTRFMGVNNYSSAPGFDFVYGYQPNYAWMAAQAQAGRLSRDSLFNAQFQQTYSRNISAQATLLPHKSFRVDLTLTQTFSKSHSELYADTGTGTFEHLTPYQTGSFSITHISTYSMFRNSGVNSEVYNSFLANRQLISNRLGRSNPYTNGLPDPFNPGYAKGYGPFSQDVLIPSFIAAYGGKDPTTASLIDYEHNSVRANPFRYFMPMPNWRVTYNGLSKIPFFAQKLNNFVVNHAYTGTIAMNSFNSSLLFGDLYGLGFPSFIDSNSRSYVPYFQVPNVTLTQAFNPLIGFDAAFKSNLTAKFEVRRSKTQSLSLIDYQVGENASTEYVIGGGFRKKGIRLPFPIAGKRRLKNEAVFKLDIGIRDDKSSNTFLANNVSVTSRGQKVIRVNPTINYTVNELLTLLIFFDRQQTLPYVSNAFPTTTTRAGVTLRFNFAP